MILFTQFVSIVREPSIAVTIVREPSIAVTIVFKQQNGKDSN
jgi:hypothetical protein